MSEPNVDGPDMTPDGPKAGPRIRMSGLGMRHSGPVPGPGPLPGSGPAPVDPEVGPGPIPGGPVAGPMPGGPMAGPGPIPGGPADMPPFFFEPFESQPENKASSSAERARQLLEWDGRVNVLLLGSGGREDALAEKLLDSPRCGVLTSAPGNGGMNDRVDASFGFNILDARTAVAMAERVNAGLVVIGPEAPLVEGVADALRAANIPVFGPNKAAAQVEGSKVFAKELMARAGVPTAAYRSFTEAEREQAEAYVRELGAPVVVKADGLAAGKGVVVAQTEDEAINAIAECFGGTFGGAGSTVLVEECLEGPEVSLLVLTDGSTVVPLATAQDHKRALDGDEGPNTGGMGVYSPVPFVTAEEQAQMEDVMRRVVAQMAADGTPYSGCLYGGFMLTKDGPKVLEFNARFGDPETQVVVPRMEADLLEVFLSCEAGALAQQSIGWSDDVAVSVVLASAGYPGKYEVGKPITGIEQAEELPGVMVFHAGDAVHHDKVPQHPGDEEDEGYLVTSGGRVLDVTAVASTFEEARERAYAAADLIAFEGKTLRRDIALRALQGRTPQEA